MTQHHEFLRGEPFQADRAARVQLVVGDADFGAQSEFEAVGEAGRCIDHHGSRIDLPQEAHRAGVVLGHDGVGMLRRIAVDVVYGLLQIVDDAHGEDGRQVFGRPVRFCGGGQMRIAGQDAAGFRIAAQLDLFR